MNKCHYAPEAFEPDGSLRVSPSADVVATLGKYGMAHPLTNVEVSSKNQQQQDELEKRMREAQEAKKARLRGDVASIEIEGKSFEDIYDTLRSRVGRLTALIGEQPPALEAATFYEQIPSLVRSYMLFQELGLEPQFVLAPAHRTEDWWVGFARTIEASELNPTEADPDEPGCWRYVIADEGLYVSTYVHEMWAELTDCDIAKAGWELSVMSATREPYITGITAFGYETFSEELPHEEFNNLLTQLGLPQIESRSMASGPRVQTNINPTIETYTMYQFMQVTELLDPLDNYSIATWLQSDEDSFGTVATGSWNSKLGAVVLGQRMHSEFIESCGVRPTVSSYVKSTDPAVY